MGNDFIFKIAVVILFQNITGLFRIQPHAFAASVDRLRVLTVDSSPLSELSVAGIADLENLVDFEVTTSVDQLTVSFIESFDVFQLFIYMILFLRIFHPFLIYNTCTCMEIDSSVP